MDPAKISKVKVAVRIRPFLPRESPPPCLSLLSPCEVGIGQKHSFQFDQVFDHTASQHSVYTCIVIDLLSAFFSGYNATILAYGQTGSGKTFTMGSANSYALSDEDLGIIPRVIRALFQEIEGRKDKSECLLKVSFLEIYNEDIIDLLDPKSGFRANKKPGTSSSVTIREEKDGSIGLYGLVEEKVASFEEMIACLERGSLSRSTASTLMNETSSRSHAIFTISLEQHQIEDLYKPEKQGKNTNESANTPEFVTAKFHFVDLAGSERIKKTGATGATLKEGININKGLLCLGNVIAALTESNQHHIPYRDSKLTRILQDSLGGNARTYMIACVSPAESNYDETLNTLKYASRARSIKNTPKINTDPNTALVNQMKQQIFELKEEILKYRLALKRNLGEKDFQGLLATGFKDEQIRQEAEESNPAEDCELKELRLKVVRYEKDLRKLEAEKHVLRKELNAKEIDFLTLKNERDSLRLAFERFLEEHNLPFPEPDAETMPKLKLLDEYNATIAKLTRDLEDRNVLLREIQGEYEKMVSSSTRDAKLLLRKTEEIEILQNRLGGDQLFLENRQSIVSSKNIENTDANKSLNEPLYDPSAMTSLAEIRAKEFLSVNRTTEKQLDLVSETIRMKEELLTRMSEGQTYLEQSLIEEMRQQYHQKIEALEKEIRALEKERQFEIEKKPSGGNGNFLIKGRLQELEVQIKEFKKKEKLQSGMAKQVTSQKHQLDQLAEEIKAIKRQKIQLMKKLKEDTDSFERWKASQQKKINDLTRKNQEKDEVIQKLKRFFLSEKKSKVVAASGQKSVLKRRGSCIDDSGMDVARMLNGCVDLIRKNATFEREAKAQLKDLEGLQSEQALLLTKVADLKLQIERLELDRASQALDYEDLTNYESFLQDLRSQLRDSSLSLDSLNEKLALQTKRLEDTRSKSPQRLEAFLLDSVNKTLPRSRYPDLVRGFCDHITELVSQSLENAEKAQNAGSELTELKREFESLEQRLRVSQAQYELNLTKITTEYEERCLFLIKQQNERMMSHAEAPVCEPQPNSDPLNSSRGLLRRESELEERKKPVGGGNLRRNYEELVEKNLKLEKNILDIAKKQQNSDKLIQILKRKLEIVTEKYDQMRKQFSKEKYIGIPPKTSENNSLGDLSGLLSESPTKTPKRDANKPGISNLKDRRELKKGMSSAEGEYLPEQRHPSMQTSDLMAELESLQDRVRTESFNKGGVINQVFSPTSHKKNAMSLHLNKIGPILNSNPVQTFQSARGTLKDQKSSFSKHNTLELNTSVEMSQQMASLGHLETEDLLPNEAKDPAIEWKLKASFEAHSAAVYAIRSLGNLLYSASIKCFKVWSLDTLKPISEVPAHNSFIKAMIIWPERNVLLTACEKVISVWDVITMKPMGTLKAHKDEIRCLHASGDLLFSAGKGSMASGALFAWDLRSPNFIEEREKSQDIFSLFAHGSILYYGSRSHQVCRLSLENSLEHLPTFESPHFDAVSSLNVFKNHLISGPLFNRSRDKNLKVWSLDRSFNHTLNTAYAHQDWINVLEKNRAETMLFSGSRDSLVKVWGIQDSKLRCLGDLNSHSQSVNSICNLDEAYENMIASGSSDKTIKLWRVNFLEDTF